jgi:hypothetical protein
MYRHQESKGKKMNRRNSNGSNALAPYGEYFIGEDKRYIPEQFTALDCAIMWDHPEIAEYLRNAGGKEVYRF